MQQNSRLQGVEVEEGAQLDQLRRQGSLQWSVQREAAATTACKGRPARIGSMDRCILLATDGNDHGQWIHVGETGLATSGASPGVTAVADFVPLLQCRPGTTQGMDL